MLLIAVLVAFAVVSAAAIGVFWTRTYRFVDHSRNLWARCHSWSPNEIRHWLVADLSAAYEHNRKIGRHKACLLRVALIGTSIEVLVVGALLLVQAVSG